MLGWYLTQGATNQSKCKGCRGEVTYHVLCVEKAAFGGGRLYLQSFGVSQNKFKCSIKVWQVDVLKTRWHRLDWVLFLWRIDCRAIDEFFLMYIRTDMDSLLPSSVSSLWSRNLVSVTQWTGRNTVPEFITEPQMSVFSIWPPCVMDSYFIVVPDGEHRDFQSGSLGVIVKAVPPLFR